MAKSQKDATVASAKGGLAVLTEALKNKAADTFKEGDVIRWKSGDKYTYAVVKAGGRWWITGTAVYYGKQIFTFDELVKILQMSEVTDIAVAVDWASID